MSDILWIVAAWLGLGAVFAWGFGVYRRHEDEREAVRKTRHQINLHYQKSKLAPSQWSHNPYA